MDTNLRFLYLLYGLSARGSFTYHVNKNGKSAAQDTNNKGGAIAQDTDNVSGSYKPAAQDTREGAVALIGVLRNSGPLYCWCLAPQA